MKLLLSVLFLLLASKAYSQVLPDLDAMERYGKIFELEIDMAFDGVAIFSLERDKDETKVILKRSYRDEVSEGLVKSEKLIILGDRDEEIIISLFRQSIKGISLQDTGGLDGSTWCLSTQGHMTRVELCFWSPSSNAEERGLGSLNKLGSYLAGLCEIEIY